PSNVHVEPGTGALYTTPGNLANLSDFVNLWQNSWAESLLPAHPEYCYLGWCSEEFSKTHTISSVEYTSEDFDNIMLSYDEFSEAEGSPLGDLTSISTLLSNDPLFNVSSSSLLGSLTGSFLN